MKYAGMPWGMWALFAKSFEKQLTEVFGYGAGEAGTIAAKAKPRYKEIIGRLPEFEKADRFKMNIVNCAMLGAFVLSMPRRPDVERLTDYYAKSMMTGPMRWFCRKSGIAAFRHIVAGGFDACGGIRAGNIKLGNAMLLNESRESLAGQGIAF